MDPFTIYNASALPSQDEQKRIVNFLFTHLGQYGDPKSAIAKCLEYALGETAENRGGFVLLIKSNTGEIQGVTTINKTGMADYIPENILVYIAVRNEARGQGIGKRLTQKALDIAEGDVALHVEPDNPAKFLYEKIGFQNKYLEMRYKK